MDYVVLDLNHIEMDTGHHPVGLFNALHTAMEKDSLVFIKNYTFNSRDMPCTILNYRMINEYRIIISFVYIGDDGDDSPVTRGLDNQDYIYDV